MKIAVCDDEKQFIEDVCPLLEAWAKKHEIHLSVFRFTDGDDLIDTHRKECMDLILFAVDSYDVKAFHYLLKPLNNDKLFLILDDFFNTFYLPEHTITAKTTEGFCKISLADVDYLEAQNKHVLAYLSGGRIVEICEQLSKCKEVFSAESGFYHCHRSYIVNLNHVEQFSKTELTTICHAAIPISRNCYTAFKEAYFLHMFG